MKTTVDWELLRFDEQGLIPVIIQDVQNNEVLMMAYMNRSSLHRTLETGQTWFWSRSRKALWHKGETSGHTQTVREVYYDCDGDALLFKVEQTGTACHTGKYSCFHHALGEKTGEAAFKLTTTGDTPADMGPGETAGTEVRGLAPIRQEYAEEDRTNHVEGRPGERGGHTFDSGQPDRFAIIRELERVIAEREAERPEGAYTTYLFEKGLDKILKKVGEEASEVIIAAKNRSPEELKWEVSDLIFHTLVLLREQKLPLNEVFKELSCRRR